MNLPLFNNNIYLLRPPAPRSDTRSHIKLDQRSISIISIIISENFLSYNGLVRGSDWSRTALVTWCYSISSLVPALFKYNNNPTTMSNVIHSEEQKKTHKVKKNGKCKLFSRKIYICSLLAGFKPPIFHLKIREYCNTWC